MANVEMDFVPTEKGIPIRPPATANLMIDSFDRNQNPGMPQASPFDFQIQRNQSLLNGFFTRVGTTEVVLEWNEPNGAYISQKGNASLSYISSGISSIITVPNTTAAQGFYTAADQLNLFAQNAQFLVSSLSGIPNVNFFVSTNSAAQPALISEGIDGFQVSTTTWTKSLGLRSVSTLSTAPIGKNAPIINPDLRPFRYLDFTSEQLTYNQDLKDNSTAAYPKDVLCRWYMDWDQQPQRDEFGFPIEMGYEPFKVRRLFNPPKQIRWDPKQPVGNLAFKVYGDNQPNPIVPKTPGDINGSEWLMTLQVSET